MPDPDPERLVDRFGEPAGLDLLQYVRALVHELGAEEIDWAVETLVSGTDKAIGQEGSRQVIFSLTVAYHPTF